MSGSEPPAPFREGRRGPSRVRALAIAGAAGLLAVTNLPAAAQQAARAIGFSLTVFHASPKPGPIDPAAEQLHESLRDFNFRSLRVSETRRFELRPGEIGALSLPSGKRVQIQPLHMGHGAVLLAVDIENTLHTDIRIPDHKPVVIGVGSYDGGKLILTVEPDLPPE
jgi:hypothetical protein